MLEWLHRNAKPPSHTTEEPHLSIRALVLCANAETRLLADGLPANSNVSITFASTLDDLLRKLEQDRHVVVFCDQRQLGSDWRWWVHQITESGERPAFILMAPHASPSLWNEVVRHGGYDVLPLPLHPREFIVRARMARTYWKGGGTRSTGWDWL